MNEPVFLTREMVDKIHERGIAAYGGGDLFDIAAAYAFHIVADQRIATYEVSYQGSGS